MTICSIGVTEIYLAWWSMIDWSRSKSNTLRGRCELIVNDQTFYNCVPTDERQIGFSALTPFMMDILPLLSWETTALLTLTMTHYHIGIWIIDKADICIYSLPLIELFWKKKVRDTITWKCIFFVHDSTTINNGNMFLKITSDNDWYSA